jgi:hypothetical protein
MLAASGGESSLVQAPTTKVSDARTAPMCAAESRERFFIRMRLAGVQKKMEFRTIAFDHK